MVNYQSLFAGLLKVRRRSVAHTLEQSQRRIVNYYKLTYAYGRGLASIQQIVHNWDWVQRAYFMYNLTSSALESTPIRDPRQFYLARHGDLFRPLHRYAHPKAISAFLDFYDAVLPPSAAQMATINDQPDQDAELREAYKVERFLDDLSGAELRKREAFTPTCNIAGLVSGYTGEGSKTVLPAKAMAKIDFRLIPEQDPHDILAKLQAHLATAGYSDIRITAFAQADPVVTPIEDPFVRRIATIAESFAGKRPSITPIAGGTLPFLGELRRYVGVPGLAAPDNPVYWGSGAHAPNEHIRLDDLDRAVRFGCYLFMELGN